MTTQNRRERFWTTEGRPKGRTPRRVSANRKGRDGCNQATLTTTKRTLNFTGLAARIKAVIVTLALWGLLPVAVADWLINLGGLRDV